MTKVDIPNEQPTGSHWEVYRDAFAPQKTRQVVRAWERAPVAAQAPRLQGHKIWKRPGNKLQRDSTSQDVGQEELEKEGAGARKRLRVMGAKENIGNAPWMEAQEDKENEGPVVLLGKDATESAKGMISHDMASDALKFVPRKRTNVNHVITPRKPLRQTTLNAQAQTQSATAIPKGTVEKSPRKRRSIRKSTRRLSRPQPELSAESLSIQLPVENASDVPMTSEELTRPVKGNEKPTKELDHDAVDGQQPADASSVEKAVEPNDVANAIKLSESSIPDISSEEMMAVALAKTPKSSKKRENGSSEKETGHIETAKTPKSTKKKNIERVDGGMEATQPMKTPKSSKKVILENVDADTETGQLTEVLNPSKTNLRRSTRNTRAISVSVEKPAIQEVGPTQAPEVVLSSLLSTEERPKTPEPQVNVKLQAPLTAEPPPESAAESDLGTVDENDTTITKADGDISAEDENEEIITDALLDLERSVQDTEGNPDLPAEPAKELPELEVVKNTPQPESKDVGDASETPFSGTLISNLEMLSEDVKPEEAPVGTFSVEASLPEPQTMPNATPQLFSADSPLSDVCSESSLINFSPESTTRTLQFDLQSDTTNIQANERTSASSADIPDVVATVDESTELTEDAAEASTPDPTTTELTEAISTNAPLVTYDHDETDMLRNFLTRVKANKAAKSELSPKRKRSLPHSPLRLPLTDTENILSSPPQDTTDEFDLGLAKISSPAKRKKRGDIVSEDDEITEPRSTRRSGRTRLPVKTPPAVPSFIPVRRMGQDGDTTITLKRSEEKELAALTRVNTRKNKGGALSAAEVLAKKAEEKADPALRQRLLKEVFDEKSQRQGKKKAKSVAWAEELAQFQTTNGRKTEKEKEKEKTDVAEEKKKSAVRVGIKSKIALGMAVNGTPASKRKVKGRM